MMWSIACIAKLKVMNSMIGLSPPIAAPDADAGKAIFGDRRVDHALGPELVEQALRDLVGALVLRRLPRPSRTRARRGAFPRPSRRAALRGRVVGFSARAGGHFGRVMGRGDVGDQVARCRSRPDAASASLGFGCRCFGSGAGRFGSAPARPQRRSRPRRPSARSPCRPSRRRCLRGPGSCAIVPSSTASNSIVALSVSISARMSPDLTVVAFLDQPFGERALFHRRRQRGHLEFDRHQ